MIFAKRLPLCQHAKIAMIPMVFHRVWGQLLRKILKKHPEMHFTGYSCKITGIHIFQWNLAKFPEIPAISSIWTPPVWKHQYFLRNINAPGYVNSTENKKNMDSCVILLENNVLHENLKFYMIPMIFVKIQVFAPACKNSSNSNRFPQVLGQKSSPMTPKTQ